MKRHRVLVCAFSCDPYGGSGLGTGEDTLGWNMILQIRRFHDIWVMASALNRKNVETELRRQPQPGIYFYYFDLPPVFQKLIWKSRGGIQLYAYFWQIFAAFRARRLHRHLRFEAFYHITYANDWMASFPAVLLPIPFIRGPGGGTHPVPRAFLRSRSVIRLTWEYIRLAGKRIFRLDPFFMISQTRARALLLCNQEARKAAGRYRQGKTILFPVNGLTLEELSLIDSIEPGSKGEYFRVLSVGRFIPLKGFDWGLRAFKRFLICCPEAKAEMVIIGEGPDEFYLKALIRSLGLEASVFIKPWIPRRDVFREMRQSDVFLFPSLYDGGGFVVVEAMAAGLPVICLDSGGPGFHVQPEWGIKIPPSNPYEAIARMEDALCRLFRDPAQRNALRQTARARVVDYYRWERLGDRLAKIFSHILDG